MQHFSHNRKKLVLFLLICAVTAGGCRFYFQRTTDTFSATRTANSVQNGKNLALNVCAGCHYDESAKKYIGIPLNDLPRIAGKLYSANLTHSKTHGKIDGYSDAELLYLLKTGISKSGKFMPYMMRPTMADADINDLILYFRSKDAPLAAADTTVGKTRINLIGRMGIRMASKPSPYIKNIPEPNRDDAVEYGRYLVGVIGCYHCHSKKINGLDYSDPEKSKGFMQGGMKMKDYDGNRIYSSNLTPDTATGIGHFSEADFSKAVRQGVGISGKKLSPPMPVFADMTRKQSDAIYAYLRQLSPVRNAVKGK